MTDNPFYRVGRRLGYAGVQLTVVSSPGLKSESIAMLVQGHLRGQDEREIDGAMEAWGKLMWDDREPPERSEQ